MRWLTFAILFAYQTSFSPYHSVTIYGWKVHIDRTYLLPQHRTLSLQVLRIINVQLREIRRVLPQKAVKQLTKKISIWLEYNANPLCKGNSGVFRTGTPTLLLQKGLHPFKHNAIEICGAKIFYDTVHTMPSQLLHELAHAYHMHFVTAAETKLIQQTYQQALQKKLYLRVKMYKAPTQKGYARYNVQEYFAEATESFFGKNNAYPFNKKQLKQYDFAAYRMIQRIWKVKKHPPTYKVTYGYASYYKGFHMVPVKKWK